MDRLEKINVDIKAKDKKAINCHIDTIIEKYKNKSNDIDTLLLDSVSKLTAARAQTNELKEQSTVKRLFNDIRGINHNISNDINKNIVTSQYAAIKMIQRLSEQNLITVEMVKEINKKFNKINLQTEHEINSIYEIMVGFWEDINKQNTNINELKTEVEEIKDKIRRMNMNCKNCNTSVKEGQFICYECGAVLDKEIPYNIKDKLNNLSQIVRDKDIPNDYLWDETVARYAKSVNTAKRLLSSDIMEDKISGKMFKDMDNMLNRCKSAEFHIALVGTIKAGKSTLLNSIIGVELTPANRVTPETASLTKFRASKDRSYVKVEFYKASDWNDLWNSVIESKAEVFLEEYEKLNAESEKEKWIDKKTMIIECDEIEELKSEIEKWTSSKSQQHYFVKEVEVGLAGYDLPSEVVYVDTPGLDDVVQYRSDITRDYIDRANAVLVCVKSDALSGQEMGTIYSVFANTRYNPEKVYIVATQLDTLNRPEKNWTQQRDEWLKYLKRADCFGSSELALKNILPVSGYLYTLLGEFNTYSEDDDRYYDLISILPKFRVTMDSIEEKYEYLKAFTGIDKLKLKIKNEVISNYKAILLDDIKENYVLCRDDITNLMKNIIANQNEVIETSEKGIDEIKKKSEEYSLEVEKISDEKIAMERLLKTIKIATTDRAKALTNEIRNIGGVN